MARFRSTSSRCKAKRISTATKWTWTAPRRLRSRTSARRKWTCRKTPRKSCREIQFLKLHDKRLFSEADFVPGVSKSGNASLHQKQLMVGGPASLVNAQDRGDSRRVVGRILFNPAAQVNDAGL